jgi:hypothetical protein
MPSSDFRVIPVTTKKQQTAFARFPWHLYRNDPNWVAPIYMERRDLLDPAKHPFHQHAEVQLFLAVRGKDEVIGTISAQINHLHNQTYKDKVGFFGFFDTVEEYPVAEALLNAAAAWLRERGMEAIRGPESFSQNEECGLLIDAFDQPPVVMMTYNPPYYVDFIERAGFEKAQDLYAWDLLTNIFDYDVQRLPAKFIKVADHARQCPGLELRQLDLKRFDHEIKLARQVYNEAWEANWGFVPMTDAEFEHLGESLKMVLDPALVYIALIDGKPVGISVGVPDVNRAFLKAKPQPNLWSLPLLLLKFLWYRRKLDTFRLVIMGVVPEHRALGIDALFYVETARSSFKKGYKRCEMSWILESNDMMNRIIERLGGRIYKTYRLYQKPV